MRSAISCGSMFSSRPSGISETWDARISEMRALRIVSSSPGPLRKVRLPGPSAARTPPVNQILPGGHDVVLEQAQDLGVGIQNRLEQLLPGVPLHPDAKIRTHRVPFLGLVTAGALPFEDLLSPFRVGPQFQSPLVVPYHTVPLVRGVGLKPGQGPVPNRFVRVLGQQDPVVLLQRRRLHGPALQRVQQPGRPSEVGDQRVKGRSPLAGREGAPAGENQVADLHVAVSSQEP